MNKEVLIWQVDFHLPIQSMYFTSEAGELDPLSMVKCTCHHYIFFSDEQKITGFLGYFFLYINKTEILLKKKWKTKIQYCRSSNSNPNTIQFNRGAILQNHRNSYFPLNIKSRPLYNIYTSMLLKYNFTRKCISTWSLGGVMYKIFLYSVL